MLKSIYSVHIHWKDTPGKFTSSLDTFTAVVFCNSHLQWYWYCQGTLLDWLRLWNTNFKIYKMVKNAEVTFGYITFIAFKLTYLSEHTSFKLLLSTRLVSCHYFHSVSTTELCLHQQEICRSSHWSANLLKSRF